jgi:hypothetical protein
MPLGGEKFKHGLTEFEKTTTPPQPAEPVYKSTGSYINLIVLNICGQASVFNSRRSKKKITLYNSGVIIIAYA